MNDANGIEEPGMSCSSLPGKKILADALTKAVLQALGPIADSDFEDLVRAFRPVAHGLLEFSEAYARGFRALAIRAGEWVEKLDAAPEIEGHERLLVETVGHHPLLARLWAYAINRWGAQWAAEVNDGRRASALARQIVKASEKSSLVISRRALKLQQLCRRGYAWVAVEEAIQGAGLAITPFEFDALIERACRRDEAACRALTGICALLTARLPDPRGRPLSDATGIHVFLRRHLESVGITGAYTYTERDGKDDFSDRVTLSTRLATNNRDFSPLRAIAMLKRGDLPPVERVMSATQTPQRSRD